jgi:acyl-CoA hydrolase
VAVVNGHLVREGETLEGGARVVKIGSDSVELEIKGARRVVRF